MLQRFSARLHSIAPFTVFHSTGMLMARPMPLQEGVEDASLGPKIAREGYVSMTVIPRLPAVSETESGIFEKEKKISVKLRSRQIGQIISWKLGGKNPLQITAYAKSDPVTMEFRPTNDEIELVLSPPKNSSSELAPVSVVLSTGELRSFQILLEAALPHLYGWVGPNTSPKKYTAATSSKSPEDFFKQFSAAG